MQAKFHVKNFGPIVNAKLALRNVNVFIGPQASGKSVLAKLYTICKSPLSFLKENDLNFITIIESINNSEDLDALKFEQALANLNIHNFLNSKSVIEYESEVFYFKYYSKKITFNRKFKGDIDRLNQLVNDNNIEESNKLIKKYFKKFNSFKVMAAFDIYRNRQKKEIESNINDFFDYVTNFDFHKENYNKEELLDLLEDLEIAERKFITSKAKYIPSERIIISILRDATWTLQSNNIPIPKHILNFASDYEIASNELKEIDLGFIKKNLKYKNVNGIDKIYISERKSINLSESATGFQSLVPLLLPILNNKRLLGQSNSYVIEEPEINLYPKAQYELIKFLESNRPDGLLDSAYIHTYTTHSPYILSAFNNMLYAYKRSEEIKDSKEKIDELNSILSEGNWLNPENFNAYTIKDGKAKKIFNRKVGLIDDNIIDDVSDYMNDDFDRMMEL